MIVDTSTRDGLINANWHTNGAGYKGLTYTLGNNRYINSLSYLTLIRCDMKLSCNNYYRDLYAFILTESVSVIINLIDI